MTSIEECTRDPDHDIIAECARAVSASKAWPAVFEPGASRVAAVAVINELRRHGYIDLLGLEAIKKAEERRK